LSSGLGAEVELVEEASGDGAGLFGREGSSYLVVVVFSEERSESEFVLEAFEGDNGLRLFVFVALLIEEGECLPCDGRLLVDAELGSSVGSVGENRVVLLVLAQSDLVDELAVLDLQHLLAVVGNQVASELLGSPGNRL